MSEGTSEIAREVARRRTFAIISHPDAGKTTLTEKLLLFGGALREAGAVRARRAQRHATSDWLEIEKQRGISVSSSAMHFVYRDFRVNILDTPGHKDFSEDTYRTLIAADSAVMLIDAAKGVEAQTRKLFEVCRMRGIPIFTFVNKMDRYGRDPLDLMGEIEEVLGIAAVPLNWPVGQGNDFRGVYDRLGQRLQLFSGGEHGTSLVDETDVDGAHDSDAVRAALGAKADELAESLALLEGAGESYDPERVRAGEQSPMFFGSALTNFGIQPFLERFLELAPKPGPRPSSKGPIDPVAEPFSGFVFKIQANMDPDHRDRVAFVRICSGKFVRGAMVKHVRTGKPFRLANSTLLLGQGREEIDEAWPGDVVGLFDPGLFRIGDTLSEKGDFTFADFPVFPPEHFMRVELGLVEKRKALAKGLEQLAQEGAVQLFTEVGGVSSAPIVGAVGPLQFDVLKHRMASEYKVELRLSPMPHSVARWARGSFDPEIVKHSQLVKLVQDREGRPVLLSESASYLQRLAERHEGLELADRA